MSKYFAIAIVCLAMLGGIGILVRAHLAPSRSETAPQPSVRRPAVPVDVKAPSSAAVVEVEGNLQKRRGADWVAVASGDVLEADDVIRTGTDGKATIAVAGQQVTLHARTELTIDEISEKVNLVLAEGRLSAAKRDGALRIEVRNSDAAAEAVGAEFEVMSAGQGDLTVATLAGAVDLSAAGKRVRVAAGDQSVALRGRAPSVPAAIPPSLFLKVNAAGGGRDKRAKVRGETAPGAIVSVNGVRMLVASEGGFELEVPLKEGKNTLVVRVEDVRGRVESAQISKRVDTRSPSLETEVEWR